MKKWLKRITVTLVSAYIALITFIYVAQESMIFVPDVVTEIHQYTFKSDVEDVWLNREDGAKLHAVRFNKGGEKGIVLYFHGNAGNNGRSESMAETFTNLGYEVVGIDYRGYGKSRGEKSEAAMLEDTEFFYDKMMRNRTDKPIIVGWSLGTVFAGHLASVRPAKQVILFAPMASALDIAKRRYPFLPEFIGNYPFRTDLKFSSIEAPVTIYHGQQDTIVPYASGILLKNYFKGSDRFIGVEEADHDSIPWEPSVLKDINYLLN